MRGRVVFVVLLVVTVFSLLTPVEGLLQRTIHREFHWSYRGEWSWKLDFSVDHYLSYTLVPLDKRLLNEPELVTTDDPELQSIANGLKEAARKRGYDYYETADFILAFVQSLPYVPDDVSTPYDEFPKFPFETLVEGGGDCEDTSILYATLMKILGYDVVLIELPEHMMVGVAARGKVPRLKYYYVDAFGTRYLPAETTGEGWRVGDAPEEFLKVSLKVFKITGKQLKPIPIDVPELIEENTVLKQKYDHLKADYNELQNNFNMLMKSYISLNESYRNLKDKYSALEENYHKVITDLNHLKKDYAALSDNFTSLMRRFEDLRADYNELQDEKEQLQLSYNQLNQEHQLLKEKHEQLKGELAITRHNLSIYKTGFYLLLISLIALCVVILIWETRRKPKIMMIEGAG